LLVESLAAITTSHSPLGHHPLPPLESVVVRKPPVNFCWRGFLLPRTRSSPPVEVGESLREGVSEEVVGSPGAMFDAALCLQTVGIFFEGNVKGFLDVMTQVVEGQHLEVLVSTPKVKGNRELHNLECDINYDGRSILLIIRLCSENFVNLSSGKDNSLFTTKDNLLVAHRITKGQPLEDPLRK
jgi:hypothetical protein